jgi:hypothetical protein
VPVPAQDAGGALQSLGEPMPAPEPDGSIWLRRDHAQAGTLRGAQHHLPAVGNEMRLTLPHGNAQAKAGIAQAVDTLDYGGVPFDSQNQRPRWQINDTCFTA